MLICGFEKFSMVDFDGKIACTVFTGGCNFRCPFCHNGALVVGNVRAQQIAQEEVFDYLIKRKGLVDAVCVTGGEPTLQADLAVFLRQVKQLGYATKLDTNGLRPDILQSLLDENLLDYVAMDIKNSPQKYPLTIGLDSVDLDKINQSIQILKSTSVDNEFRTTAIAQFHTRENFVEIANWIKGAKRFYIQHYKDSEGCISHGYDDIDPATANAFLDIVKPAVSICGLRGYN